MYSLSASLLLPSLPLPSHCPPLATSPPPLHCCCCCCGHLSQSQSCIPCWGWHDGGVLHIVVGWWWQGLAFHVEVAPQSSARTQVTARLFTGAQQESSASCTSSQVFFHKSNIGPLFNINFNNINFI